MIEPQGEWGGELRPDTPIRVPQAFWWQGPSGGKVLHWLNEHYHLGNVLGVSSPHPFGADKTRYFLETDPLTVAEMEKIIHSGMSAPAPLPYVPAPRPGPSADGDSRRRQRRFVR